VEKEICKKETLSTRMEREKPTPIIKAKPYENKRLIFWAKKKGKGERHLCDGRKEDHSLKGQGILI